MLFKHIICSVSVRHLACNYNCAIDVNYKISSGSEVIGIGIENAKN